uniref:Putative reverse transcriptase domain-containing protein n=1 Tax=Tanacetum cinerariifolium TaxID=118510 RepID=A0A6L2LV35_TANCI|nr:putative reverse transcriptase domain-containing protein [Tanacetum cinerariifolium]
MSPRILTRSVGRPAAESLGGGTGVRVGRGGRGRRPREGNDECVDDFNGQGNDQGIGANGVGNQGNVRNQNGNVANENVQKNVGNVLNVQDMSGCSVDQKVKYTVGSFVGKALTLWNSQIRTLSQEVVMKKLKTELWNHAMVGAGHAVYTDRFHELARLVPHLVTPEIRKIERYVYGLTSQICGMVTATEPKTIQKAVQISGALTDEAVRNDRLKRGVPRNVNHVDARNPTVRGHGNQRNQARGRAFMLGTEEARQDLNILIGIEPSELGFRYEIKIASGQLAKIDKIIKSCKLEIDGHVFDIDLIPFGYGSFDVIIDGKVLRVLRERPKEKVRLLVSAKASDKKQEIVVVRDFHEDNLRNSKTKVLIDQAHRLAEHWHVINDDEIHVDPSKIDVVKNWKAPRTLTEDKLCNAPVLALPNRLEYFVVYCDASGIGLGCVLMQRELFCDYDCEIRPGKANVVADALSQKESVNPKRVRAMNMTLQSCIKDRLLTAQKEAVNESVGLQKGFNRISRIGADKMYFDLRDKYWWPGMKKDIAEYVSKCLTCLKAEVEEGQLIGPELVQETTEKISQIKDRLKKGVVLFGKKGKLAPRFVVPFEIIGKVGHVAYRLDLPKELNGVHDTFYVSNLKKCLAYPTLQVPLDEIQFDAKLNFVEEHVEILEREFKKLKRSRIAIVKVRWNSNQGPEFTWKRKDQMKLNYPYLFSNGMTSCANRCGGTYMIVMKKYVSAFPKKAAKMAELAADVLDDGFFYTRTMLVLWI